MGKIVCDSYIIMTMCVRDLVGDEQVDMIYFTDSREIFMYREGMRDAVGEVMPFHQCAVPLSPAMQAITNQLLDREDLSLSEELSVRRALLSNYVDSKPEIDACNARYAGEGESGEQTGAEDDFYIDEWESED